MRNSHLILIMIFLLFIICVGIGSIFLIVRPHASAVAMPSEDTSAVPPRATAVPVPSTSPISSLSNASKAIIGKWFLLESLSIDEKGRRSTASAADNGYLAIEFFEDGTYIVSRTIKETGRVNVIRGIYVIVDENHLSLEVVETRFFKPESKGTREFTIVGDTLTLIDAHPNNAKLPRQTDTLIRR